MENSGIEFFLNIRWINREDLTFSTSGNIARNKNIIIRSEHDYESYKDAISSSVLKGGVVNVIGKETGSIYGWKTAGVDPLTEIHVTTSHLTGNEHTLNYWTDGTTFPNRANKLIRIVVQ
ncbi:MAG: hypothetical protein ACLU4J_02070 [Butyricimonas paravirosa]